MHKQKQTLGGSIYSGLQKGLHAGQKAVEYTALAKGIYATGPYSQSEEQSLQWLQLCYKSMLTIKCGSQANRLGMLGGRQEDS